MLVCGWWHVSYRLVARKFRRTEGFSRGTHGVICGQGPESWWVRSLKTARRIAAPLRLPRPCCGRQCGRGVRILSSGGIWRADSGQPPWSRMRRARLVRQARRRGVRVAGRLVVEPGVGSASNWMTSCGSGRLRWRASRAGIWAAMGCTMVSRLRSSNGRALMMPVPGGAAVQPGDY